MAEWSRGVRAYLIIALIAAASALAGIFTLPPLDRDESRFAQATAQMLETGDFVRINFLDTERNKKPIGIHWLQAASVSALSDADARQIWAYRIPSLFGVMLAALTCFWGGARLVGREAAFAGSALFAATVLLGIEGGIAKTDAMLVGATTLAMAALANLRSGDAGRKTVMLFWFAIGLGALIKGPVTPMVAGLAVIALVVWERRAAWLKPLLFTPGPLLAIAMVLPWLIGIQIATEGNFLREALGDDLGPKLVSGHERHGGPVGYHLILLPLLIFPASLFLLPGIGRLADTLRLKIDDRAAQSARFLLAWAIPTWLIFELLPTKLPHYVLPAYPALALMAGRGFMELADSATWQKWTSWALFGLTALVFAVVFPTAYVLYGNGLSWDAIQLSLSGFEAGSELGLDPAVSALVFTAAILFAGLAGAALMSGRAATKTALVLAVLTGLSWQVMARGTAMPSAQGVRLADQVRALREQSETITGVPASEIVTASSFTEPSLVFSLGSDTVLGTTEEVLAFAESREEPTFMVLDFSRDVELANLLSGGAYLADIASIEPRLEDCDGFGRESEESIECVEAYWEAVEDAYRQASPIYRMSICHQALAAGTNYSRGDETILAILFTRCGPEGTRFGLQRLPRPTPVTSTPDTPQ